jgi:hypothetical protein
MLTMLMSALLAAQPAAAKPVADLDYVLVTSGPAGMMAAVEAALPQMLPGVRLRRATIDTAGMEACVRNAPTAREPDNCIRQLVPARARPVVALRIDTQQVSNVTGSVRFDRYSLHCIGARSITTAPLGEERNWALLFRQQQAIYAKGISDCLAEAATPRHPALLHTDARRRTPLLRLPLERFPADDANHARGITLERAVIEVERYRRTPGARGSCLLRGRITAVEGYEWLREGDMVEVSGPCRGEAPAGFRRAPDGLRPGSRARIYVGFNGGLSFVEPL